MINHSTICLSKNLAATLIREFDDSNKLFFLVGITGDGALGKSTITKCLADQLPNCIILSTDGFIMNRTERINTGILAGDDPKAINFPMLINTIEKVVNFDRELTINNYDHSTGTHICSKINIPNNLKYVLIDGTASIYSNVRKYLNFIIFIESDEDTRYYLREKVDTFERGYSKDEFKKNWEHHLSVYKKYVEPNKKYANIICNVSKYYKYSSNIIFNKCYC